MYKIFITLVLFFSIHLTTFASEEAPLSIHGVTTISAEDLITLLHSDKGIALIDARIKEDRKIAIIEGSISLPNTETDCNSLENIIPTQSSPVIFYCNGVKCGRSLKSAKIAKQCGYQIIYWFRGGIEEWLKKDFPYSVE
ncbi:MAG: rhodanese-like domain-containing protein [Gammaproteobacteria bacterium]|nr:rhodanese-like domain-containing protein [Gammaproteobacteria bacterium]